MSHARDTSGPWMDKSVLDRLAPIRREFDYNRDPLIAAQLEAINKSEAERRHEQSGEVSGEGSSSGSTARQRDKPEPAYKPPEHLRRDVDRRAFEERWLAAQRDAAMQNAPQTESTRGPDYYVHPLRHGPSR